MIENSDKICEEYKKISLDILNSIINEKYEELNEMLEKRQILLDKECEIPNLRKILINVGILEIDEKIKKVFNEKKDKIKDEINKNKQLQQMNHSYSNFSNKKLNIFNKKV